MLKYSIWVIVLLSGIAWAEEQRSTEAANLIFIANVNETIAPDELDVKAIMRGAQKKWPNGDTIFLVLQGRKAETYEKINREVFGETGSLMQRNWLKLVFSGKRNPPRHADSEKEIINFVFNTPGSAAVIRFQHPLTPLLIKAL
ncbi:MAG: hypothetical protein ACJAVI_004252 [Candidatus Azotimanducaceae bacterium]|jgi:hypothetical protein